MEVQKIKSKWKAQKRKEGLIQERPAISAEEDIEDHGGEYKTGKEQEKEEVASESSHQDEDVGERNAESNDMDDDIEAGMDIAKQKQLQRQRYGNKGKETMRGHVLLNKKRAEKRRPKAEDPAKPSLRELTSLAYSRSSLHTFKSKYHGQEQNGQGRNRSRGHGTQSGRGRGQPDMRLRMNAMLEKIKRDFA